MLIFIYRHCQLRSIWQLTHTFEKLSSVIIPFLQFLGRSHSTRNTFCQANINAILLDPLSERHLFLAENLQINILLKTMKHPTTFSIIVSRLFLDQGRSFLSMRLRKMKYFYLDQRFEYLLIHKSSSNVEASVVQDCENF